MNAKLKALLKVGEAIAVTTIPGAKAVDDLGHAIKDHHVSQTGVLDAAEGAILAIEQINGTDIADEVKFRAGVATVEAGYRLIRESLKVQVPAPPAA